MQIRFEHPADIAAIHAVDASAFAGSAEADLVDRLRGQVSPLVSLVADDGHNRAAAQWDQQRCSDAEPVHFH